jgi:protein-disulfide isomerase
LSTNDDSATGERPFRSSSTEKPSGKKTKKARPAQAVAAAPPDAAAPSARGTPWAAFVAAALVAGGATGWFLRGAQGPGGAIASPGAPAGSGAPIAAPDVPPACNAWAEAVCSGAGKESEGCRDAKAAAKLLPAGACESAIPSVDETLAKVQAARGACTTLVSRLCAELGEKTETCAMVRDKTGAFPASKCAQMMEGFDDVLAELKQMEAQNAPVSTEVAARQRAGDAPGFGPADAKVAVVVYSDFECPFCGKAATVVQGLKEKFEGKVRLVFRQFPLSFHPNAKPTAEASLAAHAQGKFWAFHDIVFKHQDALDRASLATYAKEAGLDVERFEKELDDHKWASKVDADLELAKEIGVGGTPTMLVGTKRVSNPTDLAFVTKMVEEALAE